MNKRRPTKKEFLDYAHSKKIDVDCAAYQWDAWNADGWRDGRGFAIISWKQKLLTFAKFHFGMFRNVAERERGVRRADDEVERKRRIADNVDKVNREYEERKRKRKE